MQNNIEAILKKNPLIPVATIDNLSQVDSFYSHLTSHGIHCIEITLRTPVSWEAIRLFKERYGKDYAVGVGTIVSPEDIERCKELNVDFMVSPGLGDAMIDVFNSSGIPFLPGVSTPSEIIQGLNRGWTFFKFFPADLFGGIKALKTYGAIFSQAKFCPTGGINGENANDFLQLNNVLSVGGSWLLSD